MIQDYNSFMQAFNSDSISAAPLSNPFDINATPADKQHDVWGSSVFSLPELGSDLLVDAHNTTEQTSHTNILCSNSSSAVHPPTSCVPVPAMAIDETAIGVMQEPRCGSHRHSFVSAGGCTGNPNLGSSVVYTPQTNQLSLSSLMSVGGCNSNNNSNTHNNNSVSTNAYAASTNTNPNNAPNPTGTGSMPPNMTAAHAASAPTMLAAGTYAQTSPVAPSMNGAMPAFFAPAPGGGNMMMFSPTPPGHALCLSGPTPTVFPYIMIPSPPQSGLELSGAVAYSPVAAAPPPIGVMCNTWHAPPQPVAPPMPCVAPNMPNAFSAPNAPPPVAAFAAPEATSREGAAATPVAPSSAPPMPSSEASGPRGSPPSYDSLRLQLTKRRQPPGRQRSGTNVHGSLQGICAYYSYNLSAALKQYEQPDSRPARPGEQVLPVFIQMFPCELRDRTIVVLNRVVEATCGADISNVVGIEPRSETSFIALVRTDAVWQLIHKLRCRVLMDRHGFWYAEDMEQYLRLKEYCESVRRLPQQTRHYQTDGLPCMPLVVELSRSVNAAAVTSPAAPPSFDEVAPIATVERHIRQGTSSESEDATSTPRCASLSMEVQ